MVRAFSLNVITHMCKKEEFHKGFSIPLLSRQRGETQLLTMESIPNERARLQHTEGTSCREVCAAAELYCWFQSLRVWSGDALH